MKNEEKNERRPMGDDEYQYPNEEYVTETTSVSEKEVPPKRFHFLLHFMQNNKRVTIVIAVIIVVLIVFKLMSLRHHTQVIETSRPAPVVAEQTYTPPATTSSPQVLDQLSSLKQDEQNNQMTV